MMSRHFGLSSELGGAIAKRLSHAKNQLLRLAVSSINSLQLYKYILRAFNMFQAQLYMSKGNRQSILNSFNEFVAGF